MRTLKIFFVLLLMTAVMHPQSNSNQFKRGTVSYISAQNIYVKFNDTKGISEGDSLFAEINGVFIPVILVKFVSASSCAGVSIDKNKAFKIGEVIIAKVSRNKIDSSKIAESDKLFDDNKSIVRWSEYKPENNKTYTSYINNTKQQRISGRFTINSQSNFSNSGGNNLDFQRFRYALHFNVNNLSESDFSFTSYATFTYRTDQWAEVKSNLSQALKIYDLAVNYKTNKTNLWAGRHLNNKVSNISTIDGLQLEHSFSKFTFGGILGYRPDFFDMGFNSDLFEFGAYVFREDSAGAGIMNNTIAFFQQNNKSEIDRRFIYLQHTSRFISSVQLFASSELDIYKKEMGVKTNSLSLTSLYLSANVRASNNVSFSLQYDARKDVIYYETFKSFLDSVIENETRQGFKIRARVKPFNKFLFGANFGYRFRKGDSRPSRNFGGYFTYTQFPVLNASSTFSYTRIISSFLDGNIWGISLSRDIFNSAAYLSLGFRKTNYTFTGLGQKSNQESVNVGVSSRILKPIYLSLNYEGIFEGNTSTGHVYISLSSSF